MIQSFAEDLSRHLINLKIFKWHFKICEHVLISYGILNVVCIRCASFLFDLTSPISYFIYFESNKRLLFSHQQIHSLFFRVHKEMFLKKSEEKKTLTI